LQNLTITVKPTIDMCYNTHMNYGNTVGSQKKRVVTWSREIRQLQKELSLSFVQKKVLIGTLLGDGALVSNANYSNYRLNVEHSMKQKSYLHWKYLFFQDWCLQRPTEIKKTNAIRFRTISHPELTIYHSIFYAGGKKVLPKDIEANLNDPLSVAIWFMDDGALGPHRKGLTLNTQNFSKEENIYLADILRKLHNLQTTLHKDKTYYRLYILPSSVSKFQKIIRRYVIPEMRYKLFFLTP
jgi:hypothetical protein